MKTPESSIEVALDAREKGIVANAFWSQPGKANRCSGSIFPGRTMKQSTETTDLLDAAIDYAARDLPIIPLEGKKPAIRDWQRFVATEVALRLWFGERHCNIGLRTGESGYVVVDTDTEEAEAWVRTHLPESPLRAQSGGGSTHHYYQSPARKEIRNRQGWKRIHGLDIRGQGGFIVLPPSVHPETGQRYEWLTVFRFPQGLPRFSPAWIYERTRRNLKRIEIVNDADRMVRRAAAYVAKIPGAISGQGGHNATFRVGCILMYRFGLSIEQAWPIFLHWNETCQPPWDTKDLRRKLTEAQEHGHT